MENMVEINLDRACRGCLTEEGEMQPVFAVNSSKHSKISEMLLSCTRIQVQENDGLPVRICVRCVTQIYNAYLFKQQFEQCDAKLRKYIAQAKNIPTKPIKEETIQNQNVSNEILDFNSLYATDINIKLEDSQDTNTACNNVDSSLISIDSDDITNINEKGTQTDFNDISLILACSKCDKKFRSREELKVHKALHKDDPQCLECGESFAKPHLIQRHLILSHTAKHKSRSSCLICNSTFRKIDALKKHMMTHIKTKSARLSSSSSVQKSKPEQVIINDFNPDTSFEDAEMLCTEPDIDILDLANVKEESNNFENTYDNSDRDNNDDDQAELNDYFSDNDNEYKPKKSVNPIKKTLGKVTGRKRGRPRKIVEPAVKTESPDPDIINLDIVKNENIEKSGEFPCQHCNKVLSTAVGLEIHTRQHTGVKLFKCQICEKTFTRSTHLKRHEVTHSAIKAFKCTVCDKGFNRMDHLNLHMYHHSDKKPHECDICQKGFTRAEHLRKHKESRHGDKVMPTPKSEFCTVCKKGFTTAKYLQIHMRCHNGDKTYTCKICAKNFNCKAHLVEHNKSHSNEKPFLCSECGQRFIRNDYLVIHMRRHKGEKPYKCRYCGKGFPRATDLTVHERYHTGEKTHLCTICGKGFTRRCNMVVHFRIHTGEKPYVCQYCEQGFAQSNDLKSHVRRHHTNERNIKCFTCVGFQRAYNLVVHMRVHTGEKPYVCPHCGKAFAQGNDLKAHVRRHTGERYNCEVCGEGFIQGYHLTQHKRAAHGIESQSHIRRVEKHLPLLSQASINSTNAITMQKTPLIKNEVIAPLTADHANINSNSASDSSLNQNAVHVLETNSLATNLQTATSMFDPTKQEDFPN